MRSASEKVRVAFSLPPLLHKRAPVMPLEIEENLTTNLNQMLLHGKLDAIIVGLPHEETGVMTRPLYEEPFKVVVPITHAWAKKNASTSTA